MGDGNPDIEIFGQKLYYPNSWSGVIFSVCTILFVCITVLGGLYIGKLLTPEQMRTVGSFFGQIHYEDSGDSSILKGGFRFEFWTPSVHSAKGLEQPVKEDQQWQIHDPPKRNIAELNRTFGERLKANSRIGGYRRYEAVGEGSKTPLKSGWWWVIGIQGDYSDDFKEWFIIFYREHWGAPILEKVYIEVLGAKV